MAEIVPSGTILTTAGSPYVSPRPLIPQKLIISEMITFLKRNQYALLRYLGIGEKGEGGNIASWRLTGEVTSTVSWLEDEIVNRETTTPGFDDTTTTIPLADATLFRIGDVLESGDELMRVTNVDSGVQVTVTRGFAGTTAAAAAADAAVVYRTRANLEGSDVVATAEAFPNESWNVVQNMKDAARVSFASMRVADYGNAQDRMANNIMRKYISLVDGLNNAVYKNDMRVDGSDDGVRMMAGLPYYITGARGSTIIDAGGAPLAFDHVKAALRSIANQTTEVPSLMVTDATGVSAVAEWFSGSVRTALSDTRGGVVINTIVTPFGELDVLVDFTMPPGNTWLLNTNYVDVIPADPFGVYEQTTQGDSFQRMIHGEYSFLLAGPKAHAHIYGYNID